MPRFRYVTADVFTSVPFGGNQLAVFPDARGIPERRLLDVTREFNFSEVTFVYPPMSFSRSTFGISIVLLSVACRTCARE